MCPLLYSRPAVVEAEQDESHSPLVTTTQPGRSGDRPALICTVGNARRTNVESTDGVEHGLDSGENDWSDVEDQLLESVDFLL